MSKIRDVILVIQGRLASGDGRIITAQRDQYKMLWQQAVEDLGYHRRTVQPLLSAVARLIAKIDPAFAQDMFDPKTIAESQAIADRVLRQLRGDEEARAKHGPYA